MVAIVLVRSARILSMLVLLVTGFNIPFATLANATEASSESETVSPAEQKSAEAWAAAQEVMQIGPVDVPLRDLASISVPASQPSRDS